VSQGSSQTISGPTGSSPATPGTAEVGGRAHIVITDDQSDNLLILEDLLGRDYTVHPCRSGTEALAWLEAGNPADLLLLDVLMPEMDGFEVCRRLKASPATSDLPIIFLTGLDNDTDEARGLALGAEDFIHKPFSAPVVLARVGLQLRLAQTARLLRQRNQDLERLTTSISGIGLWDYDLTHDCLSWSEEMFRLHGLTPDQFGGRLADWLERLPMGERERLERLVRQLGLVEQDFTAEVHLTRPDQLPRVVRINGVLRRDGTGQPLGILGNCWDVTDYHQTLDQLRVAKEQAEAASAAKSTFLAAMSHELRTPLNAIIGFGQLLRDTETRADRRESIEMIWQSGHSLLKLVENLLDLSKIEAGKVTPQIQLFDLNDELGALARLFLPDASAKGLTLTVSLAPGVGPRFHGDPNLLRQVLINLVGNALKFTPRGSVDIRVEPAGEADAAEVTPEGKVAVLFHVIDTGIGIQPENQDRIFEMFEQEDGSLTRRFGGAGLGLAISRRLVTLLGGRIWLSSIPSLGSRFSFTAAFEPDEFNHQVLPGETAIDWALIGAAKPSFRVLVVEDDIFSRRLFRQILEDAGYQVWCAENGMAALDLLADQPFDLILMDLQMPLMNGLEVTRRIRTGAVPGCRPEIPVIAATAHAMRGDRDRFLDQGVTDYVSKPVELPALLSTLRHWLPTPRPS